MMRLLSRPSVRRLLTPFMVSVYVDQPVRFLANELTRRKIARSYRLRESGVSVVVRHPHVELWMLDEIFRRRVYEPPVEVLRRIGQLGRPPRILDLGACAGLAGAFFLGRFPGAEVVALEPDPQNAGLQRRAIAANGPSTQWSLVEAAAATSDGIAELTSDHFLSRIVPEPVGLRTTTVRTVELYPHLRGVDLVKMDVQGSEWALLSDERFATAIGACAIVLEYHPAGAPSADGRAAAAELLAAAGFRVHPSVTDEHLGEGTLWAYRNLHVGRA